jgi:hypothetical protein
MAVNLGGPSNGSLYVMRSAINPLACLTLKASADTPAGKLLFLSLEIYILMVKNFTANLLASDCGEIVKPYAVSLRH